MYCRYIDDCYIVTSTQSEMDECFRILNEQSQYITFTRERPRNGWLPYLNTQLMHSHGILHVKWYRKESSKNIILHACSAHPAAVKRAIIRNMYRTAASVCTGACERQESLRLADEIVASNGYSVHSRRRRTRPRMNQNIEERPKIPLCLPFISDRVSDAIRQSLLQSQLQNDVVLVNIPNRNIRRQLVRNRLYDRICENSNCVICPYGKPGDCAKSGVVYEIECMTCHAKYIGETGRMLRIRINEHLASKRRGSLISPLGKHRRECHDENEFYVKCRILAYEPETSARKTLEALWILARVPEMNSRNEQMSITSDLMPFLSLCGL